MKNLNLFRKSARGSKGSTLASAVVRPSFDRRSTVVKHLAFMLLFLLGSLNVWGEEVTLTLSDATTDTWTNQGASGGGTAIAMNDNTVTGITLSGTSGYCNTSSGYTQVYASSTFTISSTVGDITKIVINAKYKKTEGSIADENSNSKSLTGSFADYTFNYTGVSSMTFTSTKQNYVAYITVTYTPSGGGSTPTCATPTFSPADGETFEESINVEISAEDGTTIYYTTDGETPTTSSSVYSSALNFTETTTVKAIAVKEGSNNSAVAEATYTKTVIVSSYTIDFETANLASYVNWDFSNLTIDNAITAKDGSHYAKTNGTSTASITSKSKIANPGTLTYYISKVGTNTNANSKWKARVSSDGSTWTIVGDENAAGAGVTQGTWNECTADLSEYSNVYVQVYYDGTSAVRAIDAISLEMNNPAAVAKPTISGETPFLISTTVTLACATDGATIYYSTDGSDPKTSGTTGTTFTLFNDATVRAIAKKDEAWSEEATPKTFTKIEPDYTTIAAFLTDQPSEDKYIQFAGNVVVTGVNGKNVYVQDESGNAICLYFATAPSPAWTKGHKVTGMFQAKYASYGNLPEMYITAGNEGTIAATETANIPDPTEITSLAEATINANMCKYVVLKGVYFQGQSLTSKAVDLQDASSNELKFYDNLSLTSGKVLPLTATACDVTGVLISYHQNSPSANINEILPVDVACINAGAAALPTLSTPGSTDEEHPTMVANGEAITVTPAAGFTSTLNGESLNAATNISITETESNTVIAVSASRDYYATANATYYFKANPAGTKYAITVVQPAEGGTLEANFAETEAGNTVTLTATPTNSHFTFDGWVVKKTGEPEATPETVTANQFTMPEYGVTVTGSFTEEDKATLTFAKGEADGAEAAPASIEDYAGEVTLPACPFTYAGHYFIGWKKGETEDIYQPGAYTITAADVTAGTVAFTAQWAAGYVFEWIADGHGYTNGQEIGLVNSEPIAIEFATGSKYYTSDKTARFYTGGTLTITAPTDYVISKIEFSTTEWGATASKPTLSGTTWTGLAEEVVFTATATSKVKSIKIYYKEGVASTLEIDDIEMEYGDVVTISPKTVTPAAAASHVSYEIKSGSDDCITLEDDQITAKSVPGTATIVATIPDAEGGEYIGTSIEFTVSVSAPDSRKKAQSPNAGFASISGDLNADIAYAAYQGGGTAAAKINGTAIQLYQPGSGEDYGGFVTVTAVKGCKIDQVKITTATNATKISYSKDGGDLSDPQTDNIPVGSDYLTPAELNAQSVNLYCMGGGSSNRLYIAAMTVYYIGEPAALHHLKLSGEYPTEFEQGAAFSHEGLVVTACYDEGETDTEVVTDQAIVSTPNMNVAGEQTITVSFGGKTAEYTINVNAAEGTDDLTGTWRLVTDAADLMAGMKVIIAQHVESDGAIYTMGDQQSNNRDAVASTVAGTTLAPNFRTRVFVLEDAGNGMFALKSEENGQYLYAASSGSNHLKSQDNVDANAKWTITISGGVASIIATESSNHNVMRYNSNNELFSCYESGQQAIALYARQFDYTREIAQGVLSTTCLPNGGQIFGASIFEIAYMDYEADGTTPHKIYFDEVEGGIMEAGMPYVILANEGAAKFGVYYTDSENKTAQSKKGLVGYIGGGKYLEENDYFIYNNMFYYVSATDATNNRIHVSNNRAYINLSQVPGYNNEPVSVPAPGRRRVSLGNGANAPAVATGVEDVQGDNVQCTKVLINGQLFILRGEKMYDAKGQLVK